MPMKRSKCKKLPYQIFQTKALFIQNSYSNKTFQFSVELILFSWFLGSNTEAQAFLSRGGQIIVRMRGLPFTATAQQVVSTVLVMVLCMT